MSFDILRGPSSENLASASSLFISTAVDAADCADDVGCVVSMTTRSSEEDVAMTGGSGSRGAGDI